MGDGRGSGRPRDELAAAPPPGGWPRRTSWAWCATRRHSPRAG